MTINNEHILVIKLGALGDFVQALGAMKAIRDNHKDAHITLLTTKSFEEFGKKCGYFDDILIDKKPQYFDVMGWLKLKKRLINSGFTRIYDLQNNDRTSLYFKLFPKSKRPEWVGAAKGASHQNASAQRIAGHAFDGHKQTLALAGVNNIEIDNFSWVEKENISKFNLQAPYIIFVAGCSPQHPHKRWPEEKYGELANILKDRGYQVVLIGTNSEIDAINSIKHICPESINLCGETDLFQVAALAKNANAAIGNDTGPMHIIAATGCHSITLFSGSSDPKRHAPMGSNSTTLQQNILSELEVKEVLSKLQL